MLDYEVTIKLSRQRMDALCNVYQAAIGEFYPENEHELLLQEHLTELCRRFIKALRTDFNNMKFKFSATEALAFVQFWQLGPMEVDNYTGIVLNDVMAKIDKTVTNNKALRKG